MKLAELVTEMKIQGMQKYKSDVNGVKTQLGKVEDSSKKTGMSLKAAFAAGTVAAAALSAALIGVTKLFIEQQQAIAKLDASLQATGGAAGLTSRELQAMAADLQKTTTFGDEATIAMQALLLTFKNIKGDEFKEATGLILDMSVAMGQDLQSTALQVGKALNDPIKGLTALSRVGVTFTEGQTKMIKEMARMGNVAGAQRIIMQELASEFGGNAAKQAETLGGEIEQLTNDLGDMGEEIGGVLEPSIRRMVSAMNDGVKSARNLSNGLGSDFSLVLLNVTNNFIDWGKAIARLFKQLSKGNPILQAVKSSIWQLQQLGILESPLDDNFLDSTREANDLLQDSIDRQREVINGLNNEADAANRAAQEIDTLAEARKKSADAWQAFDAGQAKSSLDLLVMDQKIAVASIDESYKADIINLEEYGSLRRGLLERQIVERQQLAKLAGKSEMSVLKKAALDRIALERELSKMREEEVKKDLKATQKAEDDKLKARRAAAREDLAAARGGVKEAQEKLRSAKSQKDPGITSVQQRIQSLQVALLGGKKNKAVEIAEKQLDQAKLAERTREQMLDAIVGIQVNPVGL
jgi:hypothetical protein